jgi:hypothetical protein
VRGYQRRCIATLTWGYVTSNYTHFPVQKYDRICTYALTTKKLSVKSLSYSIRARAYIYYIENLIIYYIVNPCVKHDHWSTEPTHSNFMLHACLRWQVHTGTV